MHDKYNKSGGGGGGGGSTFGSVQYISGISVYWGYTMSTFVGGVKCIVGIFECIGGYHQSIRVFHNSSDIPKCTPHMSLRVKIVTRFKKKIF